MSILQLFIIAAFAFLIGQLKFGRTLILLAVSTFLIYWLQPVQQQITLTFWLPTATLVITVLVWLLTSTPEVRGWKQNLPAVAVIVGILLLVDLNRYFHIQSLLVLLLFSAISAGHEMAGPTPLWIVNEPMVVVPQSESMLRYNAGYPRWAYDQYRQAMAAQALHAGWNYLDLWNIIPPHYFLDASLHLGAEGERLLVERLNPVVQTTCNKNYN